MVLALEIENLCKTYSNGTRALIGVNLKVEEGEFIGLLGPNGAGKTTTINVLHSLALKSSGTVRVCGFDLDKDSRAVKSCLGLVPQEFNFHIFETVRNIVVTQAGYFGLSLSQARESADYYLEKLGLWEKRNTAARHLSGGMKRRLMIARGLVHHPRILILDEPTAGVDIELRRMMWSFLKQINADGTTIILTTHYLEEAEALCDRIAIINRGIIVEDDTKKNLLEKLRCHRYTLDYDSDSGPPQLPDTDQFEFKMLDNDSMEVVMSRDYTMNDLFQFLSSCGVAITGMRNTTNRLEEVFVEITKEHANAK